MAKRISSILILCLAMTGCIIVADVNGEWDWDDHSWTKRSQTVVAVDHIEFSARGTLYVTQGDRDSLRMEGLEGALEQLQIKNQDGALVITQIGDNYRWFEVRNNGKEPIYTLEITDLRRITHSGHGEVNVGPFTVDELEIKTSGHAKTNLASINAQKVTLSASNHAHIKIETLDSDTVDFTTDGHADVYIQDSNVLDASVAASSHSQIWLAGQADSLRAGLRDHADLNSGDFKTAVSTVRVRDHAKAIIHANDEARIDEHDHARVAVTGAAKVVNYTASGE